MPFKSEAQRRWMHKNQPAMAKRWEAEEKTPAYKKKKKEMLNALASASKRKTNG